MLEEEQTFLKEKASRERMSAERDTGYEEQLMSPQRTTERAASPAQSEEDYDSEEERRIMDQLEQEEREEDMKKAPQFQVGIDVNWVTIVLVPLPG